MPRPLAVLVLLALAAFGACSSDDESASPAPSTSTSTSSENPVTITTAPAAGDEPCSDLVGKVLTEAERDGYCTEVGQRAGWMGVGNVYALVTVPGGEYLGLAFCEGQPVGRAAEAPDC